MGRAEPEVAVAAIRAAGILQPSSRGHHVSAEAVEDGPMAEEVFTAVAAVTAAEDSMVAVSIHDRQDEAPLLSVMGEALMPLYHLLYLLLFL